MLLLNQSAISTFLWWKFSDSSILLIPSCLSRSVNIDDQEEGNDNAELEEETPAVFEILSDNASTRFS